MKIKICDSIMGAGKSSAAIHMMNTCPDRKYLYVTPYLDECQRIIDACPKLAFKSPLNWNGLSKLHQLEELLAAGENIVSTHALFAYYRTETLDLIRAAGYTLVLDEVMNVIDFENLSSKDIRMMFNCGLATVGDDQRVIWLDEAYDGKLFRDVMTKAKAGNLVYYNDALLFWTLPVVSFKAFAEVYVLTYMFKAQMQSYYYEINGLEVEYIGVDRIGGVYQFVDHPTVPEYAKTLVNKIHILDDEKLNEVGMTRRHDNPLTDTALSSTWYKHRPPSYRGPNAETVAKNIYNALRNKWKCKSTDAIWTVYKAQAEHVKKRGYASGYVPCSMRATNEYRDRHYLVYGVNVFFHPMLMHYFTDRGATIDQDGYALSEMVQWIWRSAIRCGEEVWIYVPSVRMRTLLKNWLAELASA